VADVAFLLSRLTVTCQTFEDRHGQPPLPRKRQQH